MKGLDEATLAELTAVFARYPQIAQVKLYGSRAKGTAHERSDIDLAVFGEGVDRFVIASILMDLDKTNIVYAIDLQNYHHIKNPQLKAHIDRVGVVVYKRH